MMTCDMTMLTKLSLLLSLLLAIVQLQPNAVSHAHGSAVTIDVDAEASSGSGESEAEEDATTSSSSSSATCQASSQPQSSLFNGKLSSCDTFQIVTLSSPRRCIHIEASSSDTETDDNQDFADAADTEGNNESNINSDTLFCTDYHNWFDGTNGCNAYTTRNGWCSQYGQITQTKYTANEACCVCGGGWRRSKPRLQVGAHVKVSGYGHFDACPSLQIVKIETTKHHHHQQQYQPYQYLVQVQKACGPMRVMYLNNVGSLIESYQPGQTFTVSTDDPNVISKLIRVELKKCRIGRREQEFSFTPMGEEDVVVVTNNKNNDNNNDGYGGTTKKHHFVVITHPLTQIDLSTALETSSPFFNVTQVFDDGLFDGSDEYFYLNVRTKHVDGRVNWDGTPYDHGYSYLSSGSFGQKEYSTVEVHSQALKPTLHIEEFSMWQFKPVAIASTGDGSSREGSTPDTISDIDEHAEWLVRMTERIGIDYLEQLPPWDLLDIERDATKLDVKSRFRELSRSFHPDKHVQRHPSDARKELFERIFVLLQNAYQGLKSANEAEKEKFRIEAESSSQLFARSQSVVELLPFHWTKLDNNSTEGERRSGDRYILNVASHLNSTFAPSQKEENETSVQIWVVLMYSARCGMSRTIVGMVDLAARHLQKHENIKVGAYGCGLYKDYPPDKNDPTGVTSDPICAQFKRRETPNVHVVIETIPGRVRGENGNLIEDKDLDQNVVYENAQFKHFYSAVPNGNTIQFFPHNFIDFARSGKRLWQNNHLVHRMTRMDFSNPTFAGNVSIVAYVDGTGNDEKDSEIVDAIVASLPGVARRFLNDNLYVGIAYCGSGDDGESHKYVDCSELDVSWLPDIKVYGVDDTNGISLVRGKFSDVRDVQIGEQTLDLSWL